MQKILFVLHMPPPVHGASMVGKYIHDSKLINDKFDCHYINLTTAKNLQDIGKSGIGKLWRFVKLLLEIRRKVRNIKPQLVYTTPNAKGSAFYKDFIVVQMLKALDCSIVCHYHNKGIKTRQDKWLDNFLYRSFFKGIKVILLADVLYDDICKYVKRGDVFVCPNGIPETEDGEYVRTDNAVPRLLFLSNLLVEKGVFVLLDALQRLKDNGYHFTCDFVGGETAEVDAERLEEEVRSRGLDGIVVYRGRKYGEEKNEMFRNADIFVFPTYYNNECFPLVLLEAMQYGTACISTDEGGISDIIDDNETGYIVERHNAAMLAERMGQLMADRVLCRRMGCAGREKYKRVFTLTCFERQFAYVMKECLDIFMLERKEPAV